MRSRALVVGAATLVGAALGWLVARGQLQRHRQDLFHPRPLRRLAALGYLEGSATPDSLRLLTDYLAWEQQPRLRRRAEALVRRLERGLR